MKMRTTTAVASILALLGLTTSGTASFLPFGTKKDSTSQQVDTTETQPTKIQQNKLRITAHFTNIFAVIEPTPVIRRSVRAGEEFQFVDSSSSYWIIRDGNAAGYVARTAAAIVGTSADTVLTPVIDTLSAKDIPTGANAVQKAANLDTTIRPAAAALEAQQADSTAASNSPKKPLNIPLIIAIAVISLIAGGSYITSVRRKALRRVKFRSAILVMNSFGGITIDYGHQTFSLKKFLLRFGIALDQTRSLTTLPGIMAEIEPDFIFVDWRIAPDVVDLFRQLLGQYRLAESITVIFCYVDLAGISQFKNDFGSTPVHVFSGVPSGQQLSLILKGEGKPYHRGSEAIETGNYLAGVISGTSLEDVMQMIDAGKKSGALEISDDDHFGEIYFNEGTIVHASTRDGLADSTAIKAILRKSTGSFCFNIQHEPSEISMNSSVMAILMEWSAQKDQETATLE